MESPVDATSRQTQPLPKIEIIAVPDVPMIQAGDDLAAIIFERALAVRLAFEDHDVVVVTQKVVSKAEGHSVQLGQVEPSSEALEVAALVRKDARFVEVVLRESRGIMAMRPDLLVVENSLGIICANAGIDRSNIEQGGEDMTLMLLPQDPDASARAIQERLQLLSGKRLAVLIIDTLGRPFREGVMGMAIGVAGMDPLIDMRGQTDIFGYVMERTIINRADEIAAAASMLMGQTTARLPVVIVRGATYWPGAGSSRNILREPWKDMFRPKEYLRLGKAK
jgi:coenzyme F420-0:L-glutamate ligase / coenzyme F420-1:gamma-L-glutamate ligase